MMGNKVIPSKTSNDILKHYGVLGMKWGVITEKAKGALSPNVKKLSKSGSRSNSKDKRGERLKQELDDDQNNRIAKFKDIPRFNPKTESIDDAIKKVNEGYSYSNLIDAKTAEKYGLYGADPTTGKKYIKNFGNNCMSASFAYELRRRGYDVEAGLVDAVTDSEIAEAIGVPLLEATEEEHLNSVPPKTFEELLKRMEDMGAGARGFCMIKWKTASGHICSFEVDENGKVIFIDAQTGLSSITPGITEDKNPAEYYKIASSYYILRTDNKVPNKDIVKNYVRLDDRVKPPDTDK